MISIIFYIERRYYTHFYSFMSWS